MKRLACATLAVAFATSACSDPGADGDAGACSSDQDGIVGGAVTLDLTVTDDAFAPIILKAQNRASVTLTLTNQGSRPHDLVFDCLPTPNASGCPTTSCFPDAATIGPVQPDGSATATFETPTPEGIYTFRSDQPGDTQAGQFVVQ